MRRWRQFTALMRLITIATDMENPFLRRLLVPSCGTVGLELTILHPQRERIRYADKRAILEGYLASLPEPDELIIFTDAYDVLFARGQEHIEHAYENFAQKVVFSAEQNSWPLGVVGFALQKTPPLGRYPYLNSGGLMGPARDFLDLRHKYPEPPSGQFELLNRLREHGYDTDERFNFSDQYYWTLVQHLEPDWIGIDHDAAIFECYGPDIPNVVTRNVIRDVQNFREHGREAEGYKREYARLTTKLKEPSSAAQLHFAGDPTKSVILDLLDEGKLPEWLTAVLATQRSFEETVRIEEV